jgi:carbon storage regulator
MLILSRREKQRIKLGSDIIVTIIRVSGDKVRVGIEAPSDLIVLRDELEVFTPEERAQQRGPTRDATNDETHAAGDATVKISHAA